MQFLLSTFRHRSRIYPIVTLVSVALVTVLVASLWSRSIESRFLKHDAAVYQYFVQEMIEDIDARAILPDLPSLRPRLNYVEFFVHRDPFRTEAIFRELARFVLHQPGMVRVNVYGVDTNRIWSTHPVLVSPHHLSNESLIRALTGQVSVSTVPEIRKLSPSEQARVGDTEQTFAEMYLPIWNPDRNRVVGVVELYKISDSLFETIGDSQLWIWTGAVAVGLLVYIGLLALKPQMTSLVQYLGLHVRWIWRPENLFTFYAMLAILFVAILVVGLTWPLAIYIQQRMLDRDAEVTMKFVQALLEDMDASHYFPTSTGSESERTPSYVDFFREMDPERTQTIFGDFCKQMALQALGFVRISVYTPDGMRIWATQREQEGIRNLGNAKLVRALNGQLAVEIEESIWQLAESEAARITSDSPLFSEMYMPVWNPARDRVVGVVEVYKNSAPLFAVIDQGRWWVWVSTGSLGLILLGVLLVFMRRAVRLMEGQRDQLVESKTLSAVGELVASIADALRQPLSTIDASAELIVGKTLPSVAAQGADIRAELGQLDTWLRGLRRYSQSEACTSAPVKLEQYLPEVLQPINPSLDRQKIQLHLDFADGIPPIQADPTGLRQVLHTVIANAQEAMPDGGALSIRVGHQASSSRVEIQIGDTGCGMTQDQLNQVFHPFFTTKRRGLGIGMSLAKRVIERQEGDMSVTSAEGKGTTVTLSLPLSFNDDSLQVNS